MSKAYLGIIGLGTMGRNLLLNIAEHGFECTGFDIDPSKRAKLMAEGERFGADASDDLQAMLGRLEVPRKIILMLPAGEAIDALIRELMPHLDSCDIIIDGGNSYFRDTERREAELSGIGIGYLGVGISGGEKGARNGPSLMVGGERGKYEQVRGLFDTIAAKVKGEPCAARVGNGPAGHFVKMVHNGIEYAMMQLIAEAYDLLRRSPVEPASDGLFVNDAEIAEIFAEWNDGDLNAYLVEITATVLRRSDPETGGSLVSMIADTAGQKGTGKWASQAGLELGVPIPSIDAAVTMRQISSQNTLRKDLAQRFPDTRVKGRNLVVDDLKNALYSAFCLSYAQGFDLLRAASDQHSYEFDLAEIARIWRGGCIIRSEIPETIWTAYKNEPELRHLIFDPTVSKAIKDRHQGFRQTVLTFADNDIPAMAFAASMNYFNAIRSARLPANLIQAQRDLFGAHTYQRCDRDGTFHTDDWEIEHNESAA
ncbi:MAG TPA: NADP-dependent phosphogluconate dehydrogenase [Pyrinomonadaceae bacterium]|nr:NADP-dependent phosphogluconate dehydrogenase [Pyrinomonadaceae bacterium]